MILIYFIRRAAGSEKMNVLHNNDHLVLVLSFIKIWTWTIFSYLNIQRWKKNKRPLLSFLVFGGKHSTKWFLSCSWVQTLSVVYKLTWTCFLCIFWGLKAASFLSFRPFLPFMQINTKFWFVFRRHVSSSKNNVHFAQTYSYKE